MNIEPFKADDIAAFLRLAARENWVAEQWEFEFLLRTFPIGCFAARDDNGELIGFVTALLHGRSGWIGNLIVDGQFRGRGVGENLFVRSFKLLCESGAETVWLTASKSGLALYQKHGFGSIDTIIRWVGSGRQRHPGHEQPSDRNDISPSVCDIDCLAWGDRRNVLLEETVERGSLMADESGFIVVQHSGEARQFGPFAALDSAAAERLFYSALRTIPLGSKIYLDSPASNRAALRMFNRRRLRMAGTNELMYAGKRPEYRPELLYGLATMGSCG
jgi:ribosomal protein S18 acetylase RimI-like enzyme